MPLAEKMVSIYEEMKALKGDGPIGGFLSLGVINSALGGVLPQLLKEMTSQNPGWRSRSSRAFPASWGVGDRGTLDMAIVTEPPQRIPTNLSVHYLYSEPFALLTPADLPYQDIATAFSPPRPISRSSAAPGRGS